MSFTINSKNIEWSKSVLQKLLFDHTTKKNIIWATNNYSDLGKDFNFNSPILYKNITGNLDNLIQPRIFKTVEKQNARTKEKGEVFTPSWICNLQNNLIDDDWFEQTGVVNCVSADDQKTWQTNPNKMPFSVDPALQRTWQDYVLANRLEITCGEAPYLVSRYDTVTGKIIPISDRIGLLDRKLRAVTENTNSEQEWLTWVFKAFQSTYGFEYQGDNLLIARENLLATFYEYVEYYLQREPTEQELLKVANIISWNIWQMDGLTFTIPQDDNTRDELNNNRIAIDTNKKIDQSTNTLINTSNNTSNNISINTDTNTSTSTTINTDTNTSTSTTTNTDTNTSTNTTTNTYTSSSTNTHLPVLFATIKDWKANRIKTFKDLLHNT